MKKLLLLALAGTLALAGAAQAEPDADNWDLVGFGTVFVPEDNDVYDEGYGAELQARFWINPTLGIALAGGWSQWNLDDQTGTAGYGPTIAGVNVDGEIDLVPAGASLLVRVLDTDRLAIVLEGGARYVFVDDSNSDIDVTTRTSRGLSTSRESLDIDDGVVALAAAHMELKLTEDVLLLAGAGYQWDIDKGDVKFLDQKIQDNKLEAFFAQAGIGVRF